MQIPAEPQPNRPLSARWGTDVVRCLRAFRLVSSADMQVTTLADGTTARPRPARLPAETVYPWHVRKLSADEASAAPRFEVEAGVRIVIGGRITVDGPFEVELTAAQVSGGAWIVKQFSTV